MTYIRTIVYQFHNDDRELLKRDHISKSKTVKDSWTCRFMRLVRHPLETPTGDTHCQSTCPNRYDIPVLYTTGLNVGIDAIIVSSTYVTVCCCVNDQMISLINCVGICSI